MLCILCKDYIFVYAVYFLSLMFFRYFFFLFSFRHTYYFTFIEPWNWVDHPKFRFTKPVSNFAILLINNMHDFYKQQKVHITAFYEMSGKLFCYVSFVSQYMLLKIKIPCDKYCLCSKVCVVKYNFGGDM